jgi:DivIVA domain-containing protein
VEFRLAFRGYNERDVDAFLDRLTEDLSHLERTSAFGPGPSRRRRGPARRRRDRLQARAEAARSSAGRKRRRPRSAPPPGVAPGTRGPRSLRSSAASASSSRASGASCRTTRKRSRPWCSRSAPGPSPRPGRPTRRRTPATPDAVTPEVAGARPPRRSASASGRQASADAGPGPSEAPERVIVDSATEPAYSAEGAPAGEGRERSLRELFWGDD